VVLVVVEEEGGPDGPRELLLAAKSPPCSIDSAANESDVTVPGFSTLTFLASAGSVGTLAQHVSVRWQFTRPGTINEDGLRLP
jgi:hypothetical protein